MWRESAVLQIALVALWKEPDWPRALMSDRDHVVTDVCLRLLAFLDFAALSWPLDRRRPTMDVDMSGLPVASLLQHTT